VAQPRPEINLRAEFAPRPEACTPHAIPRLRSTPTEVYSSQEVRRIPGYHDEPLHGHRAGQRSIRLSRSYRAFYVVRDRPEEEQTIEFVSVEEVNKHDY
jgi:hypothetical protein